MLYGSDGLFEIPRSEIDARERTARTVLERDDLRIEAAGVEHGSVPSLAYQVHIGDFRTAFRADQNERNPHFRAWIHDAGVLVMHHAVPEHADRVARALHTTPDAIGRLAAGAAVETLVLSHWMNRSADARQDSLRRIRAHFDGRFVEADDLTCVPPGSNEPQIRGGSDLGQVTRLMRPGGRDTLNSSQALQVIPMEI